MGHVGPLLKLGDEAGEGMEFLFHVVVLGVEVGVAPCGKFFGQFEKACVNGDAFDLLHNLNPFS